MMADRIQPLWSRFWRQAYSQLDPRHLSLDELRRLEKAARYWHADVSRALSERQAKRGRKRA